MVLVFFPWNGNDTLESEYISYKAALVPGRSKRPYYTVLTKLPCFLYLCSFHFCAIFPAAEEDIQRAGSLQVELLCCTGRQRAVCLPDVLVQKSARTSLLGLLQSLLLGLLCWCTAITREQPKCFQLPGWDLRAPQHSTAVRWLPKELCVMKTGGIWARTKTWQMSKHRYRSSFSHCLPSSPSPCLQLCGTEGLYPSFW